MHHDAHGTSGAVGLSTGLGLFSLALGAAQLAAPQQLARAIGLRDDPRTMTLMRIFGAREIATAWRSSTSPGTAPGCGRASAAISST